MYVKSVTPFTLGNRRFSTPEVVLTALISGLVDALFRTKISVKGTFLVTLAFSSVVFAELCPTPKRLSPEFGINRVIDGDTVLFDDGSRVRLTGFNSFELKDSGWKGRSAREAKRKVTEWLSRKKFVSHHGRQLRIGMVDCSEICGWIISMLANYWFPRVSP